MAGSSHGKPITVYAAIVANFLIAIGKFIVAGITKSSAMLSEGIHSLADTGNQSLLLLGIRRSRRPANPEHPFGHGKELYFWSLIVAIVLFGVGGGISLYEGIIHLQHPAELGDPTWNYVVLGLATVFESVAFVIAFRALTSTAGQDSLWKAVSESKDPTIFVVLFEDAAALAGLVIAFLGVFFSHQLEMPVLDAVSSLLIAIILMAVAVFLAHESRKLLLGEAAGSDILKSIKGIVSTEENVTQVLRPMTMHLGPNEILLNMGLCFDQNLSTAEITAAIDRIESGLQKEHPEIKHIFLEAEALKKTVHQ